jgi:hypothetical protein
MARGIDVFRLKPSEHLSQNEIDAAMQFRLNEFNSQNQPKVQWEPTSAVAKSYVDQLSRSKSIAADRVRAINNALSRVDSLRTGKESNAKAALDQLESLASQFDADAAKASGVDQKRYKALTETLRGRAARLR